jgi:hypothetical protein
MQELFKKLWSAVVAGKPPDTVTQEAFGTIDLGVFEAAVRAHVHALGK